jgi:hypothetical protein
MAITANTPSRTADVPQVSQGTLSANATDLPTAITLVNELKQVIKNAGLAD